MSMSVLVSVPKFKLPAQVAWQRAIDEAGFDLKLDPGVEPASHTGFWPCQFRRGLSGFELYYDDYVEISELDGIADAGVPHAFSFVFGRWADEAMSAIIAASILAALTNCTLIDAEAGLTFAPELTIAKARQDVSTLEGLYAKQCESRKRRNAG